MLIKEEVILKKKVKIYVKDDRMDIHKYSDHHNYDYRLLLIEVEYFLIE
jgi:hypothetical protein